MVTTRPRTRLTYEDYLTTPDDKRYELLDGELKLAPAPRTTHQSVQIAIGSPMFRFVHEGSLGRIFLAPTDVVLSDSDVVQPDIIFVSNERARIITEPNIQGAPDLVIEILSPSTASRDRGYKRTLYEQHGVKEYWMADLDSATITVLVLRNGRFQTVGTYGKGDTVTSSVLDGFSINIDQLFD